MALLARFRRADKEGEQPPPRRRRYLPPPSLLRRERRALLRYREQRIRDLGGLVLEMVRRDRFRAELLTERAEDILAVDEAIQALQAAVQRAAELVQLRYYAGLTLEEAAEVLGRSVSTVQREWRYARAWLAERLGGEPPA